MLGFVRPGQNVRETWFLGVSIRTFQMGWAEGFTDTPSGQNVREKVNKFGPPQAKKLRISATEVTKIQLSLARRRRKKMRKYDEKVTKILNIYRVWPAAGENF